jgi:membrane protease YdiL (CAAX protease family)
VIPSPPSPTELAEQPAVPVSVYGQPEPRAPRWGFWSTTAWAVLLLLAFILGQTVVAVGLVIWQGGEADLAVAEKLLMRGDALALAAFGTFPPCFLVVWLAVRLARRSLTEYLALVLPSRRDALVGLAATVFFAIAVDVVTYLTGRNLVPPAVVEMYVTSRDSGTLIYLLLGIVIAAPLTEELIFRGFLFRGWSQTRFGAGLATLLTAPLWASLHMQYDWFFMGHIVVIGFILGWLRARSGSLLLTMGLHAVLNAWAMLETAVIIDWIK